jgi:hypothetical protein
VLLLQPVGDAEDAAEIADVLAEGSATSGSSAIMTCSAEFSAWIMFIGHGVRSTTEAQFAALFGDAPVWSAA